MTPDSATVALAERIRVEGLTTVGVGTLVQGYVCALEAAGVQLRLVLEAEYELRLSRKRERESHLGQHPDVPPSN